MIENFRHKGLRKFYETGLLAGINPAHAGRLRLILGVLAAARSPQEADRPGLGLHPLKGDLRERYSMRVSGNWRVIFGFNTDGNVIEADYLDYH